HNHDGDPYCTPDIDCIPRWDITESPGEPIPYCVPYRDRGCLLPFGDCLKIPCLIDTALVPCFSKGLADGLVDRIKVFLLRLGLVVFRFVPDCVGKPTLWCVRWSYDLTHAACLERMGEQAHELIIG